MKPAWRLRLAVPGLLLAATAVLAHEPAGQVTYLSGTLVARDAESVTRLLAVRSNFNVDDVLGTGEQSFARVKFLDDTQLALRPNTEIAVRDFSFAPERLDEDRLVVTLLKGGMRAVSGAVGRRNRERVRYETQAGGIGIRGTHFGAIFCQGDCTGLRTIGGAPIRDGLHVDVADGLVLISNRAGSLELQAGQIAFVRDADTPPELVGEEDGYRVAMPASVLFDNYGQLSSDGVNCDNCTVR